jgi:hypothetical protein
LIPFLFILIFVSFQKSREEFVEAPPTSFINQEELPAIDDKVIAPEE